MVRVADRVDVAVVGAGVGGLSAAAHLARAGRSVAVFDRHDVVGGYASCFDRDGYRFDASLHRMDAVGPGEPNRHLLDGLGITARLRFLPDTSLRQEIWPNLSFRVPHGMPGYLGVLGEHFPAERAGFAALAALAARVHHRAYALLDGSGGLPALDREVLDLQTLSAAQVIAQHVSDPRARQVLGTQGHYLGLGPEGLAAWSYLILLHGYHAEGGYYLAGGSQSLSDALRDAIVEAGGQVTLGQAVQRIDVSRGAVCGVTLASGERVLADHVIGNAAPAVLFGQLLAAEDLPARYRARHADLALSTSAVKVWLGLDRDPRALAALGYETTWRGTWSSEPVLGQALGVHLPHVVDPSCCPDGTGIVAITAAHPPTGEQPLDAAARDHLRDRLIDAVERALLPGLRDCIRVQSVATPQTFHAYTGAPGGAILGYRHSPAQGGLRRLGARTPLKGLLLSSAWVFPGGGLTATLMSGALAARGVIGSVADQSTGSRTLSPSRS